MEGRTGVRNGKVTGDATTPAVARDDGAALTRLVPCSQTYFEAIKLAEEREEKVNSYFQKFDFDGSKSIEEEELLSLLDELGLVNKLKTDGQQFATDMFLEFDENGDGKLE